MIIQFNRKKITVPGSWNEMNLKQILTVYGMLVHKFSTDLSPVPELPAKRMAITMYLLQLNEKDLEAWRLDCIQDDPEHGNEIFYAELDQVMKACTDFLFETTVTADGKEVQQVRLELTRCPWRKLDDKRKHRATPRGKLGTKKTTYFAPSDGLENLTLYELGTAFHLLEQFLSTKDEHYADQLIATVYRPAKPPTPQNLRSNYEGDIRLPYSKHETTVPQRQKLMAKLPREVKRLILFWLASCRQNIIQSYPNIFSKPNQVGERVGNDYGWAELLLALAGDMIHLDQVGDQTWSNAFTYMSYLEDQRKRKEIESASRRAGKHAV